MSFHYKHEDEEIAVLRDIDRTEHAILDRLRPILKSIKIKFQQGDVMAEGPVVLQAGQSTIASIDYFDQTGAPMPSTFVPPNITYAIDNAEIASSTPNSDNQTDAVAFVSAGVANLTASCTSVEGLALTDTETVTCAPTIVPPPVLSSIKINFSAPTPPSASASVKAAVPLVKGMVDATGKQV